MGTRYAFGQVSWKYESIELIDNVMDLVLLSSKWSGNKSRARCTWNEWEKAEATATPSNLDVLKAGPDSQAECCS